MSKYIAHVKRSQSATHEVQSLLEHLQQVGDLSGKFAKKIGLSEAGRLIGLLHDIGKYSSAFQDYIREASGLKGEDVRIETEKRQKKIDHSTSGAQIIWELIKKKNSSSLHCAMAQTLASCIAAHHSREGLLDFIADDGTSSFIHRMEKNKNDTYFDEAITNSEVALPDTDTFKVIENEFKALYEKILKKPESTIVLTFYHGLIIRFLFSSLIDADRLDTANFETAHIPSPRNQQLDWAKLIKSFENYRKNLSSTSFIDSIRSSISEECYTAAERPKGIYTLNVPTGGGKTLASLRFALHHAKYHRLDRIIYVVPYTSIIDQNADCVSSIVGKEHVLEHHSNLLPEENTWRNRVLSSNWDAPIIFTTMVQFLDTFFSAPTSDVRRLHQVANALIIFDEIQTLPIKTVHMFNNAMNFMVNTCGSSVILCTATQPLLHKVDKMLGSIQLSENSNIISNENQLFNQLKRNILYDRRKPRGWTTNEIKNLAQELASEKGNVLIIVNTKRSALDLYKELKDLTLDALYHLSTSMCPAHRKHVIESIKTDLAQNKKIICISTQLIEAGVDLDFGAVIRYLAGLDSIIQAAGRCNRHGKQTSAGPVHIVNPAHENLDRLPEIKINQEVTSRILDEFRANPNAFDNDLQSPKTISKYYEGSFIRRKEEMVYPITKPSNSNLLDLLSENKSYRRHYRGSHPLFYHQALSKASTEFRVIETFTRGIIVPYGQTGKALIADLVDSFNYPHYPLTEQYALLRQAQQYSVNLFPHSIEELNAESALYAVQDDSGILYLDERYYSDEYGVTTQQNSLMSFINL